MADRYGRVHESEDGHTDIGLSDFTVFPTDGFGLYLFIERQPRPRGCHHHPRYAPLNITAGAAVANWKSYRSTSFQSFGLAEPIARALAEENYLVPTPIQAQTYRSP